MRPVPLAKAMRARPMKLVKVSLKLPSLAEPEQPVAAVAPELAALTAREIREDAAGLAAPPPLTLVVSLDNQTIDVYRGTSLLETSKVSSGMPGHETRPGVFSILQKKEYHESNLYSAAPMPWMQRLTRSGIALHAGVVPGRPASHGCVRLPPRFATKLYELTEVGANVVVAKAAVAPRPIEHPNLFRPLSKSELAAWEARQGPDAYPGAGSINAPLRLLVARRTLRDEVLGVQRLLAELGYLKPRDFLGQMEGDTRSGIAAFQKANGLPMTGLFTLGLAAKVHEVAGKPKPPVGHLFVRQDFHRLYDVPVGYRDPDNTLGTHVFTLRGMDSETGQADWMAVSLEGDDPAGVLDRIEIPESTRQDIAARLTPGSTLIVAQFADDSPILPEGDDFIVWTGDEWSGTPPVAVNAPATEPAESDAPVVRKRKVERRPVSVPRHSEAPRRATRPWGFGRW
jgi:peptidoglycan hydrolase-like protein with peptidoglycan-binding domain